jgi:hypothetical protein
MKASSFATLLYLLCILTVALANAQSAPDKDHWRPKFNSPGVDLRATQTGQRQLQGHTAVSYNLFASGFPKDQAFDLWMWQVGSDPRPAANALLNSEGKLVSQLADRARRIDEDPINLVLLGGKGEPKRFALISTDGRYQAFVTVIPFPLEIQDGPCRLSAELGAPDYAAVRFTATGFPPKEPLTVEMHSEGERGTQQQVANEQGEYAALIFPFVKGKQSGTVRFKISSAKCSIELAVPWGKGSYRLQ